MKIFGTLFPFVETGEESLRLGRYVANYEFLTALLNYSNFDFFHIYCLTPGHFNNTLNRLSSDSTISDQAKEKVELFLFDVLEENLKKCEYHCFHLGGWGYFWAGTVALRNRCAIAPFPVTGVIHSLNSSNTVVDAFKLVNSPHQIYDGVVCTSESGKEVLSKAVSIAASDDKQFIGELLTIPLGFDPSFDKPLEKTDARKALGLNQTDIIILYLGRLSPSSKADLYPLLQVFRTLKDRHGSSLKMIFAGGVDGAELRLHKDMIHDLDLDDSVRLMINFKKEDKCLIYSSADIYVAPSDNIQETFGISIIEAMASALPVVASDMDGYRELVQHDVTGFKVPTIWTDGHVLENIHELLDPGSLQLLLAQAMVVVPSALESALETLIADKDLRVKMGRKAAEIAHSTYRWKCIISRYEAEWDRLKDIARFHHDIKDGTTPFSPRLSHLFSHYTTHLFSDRMSVCLRPAGEKLLQTGIFPAIYSDMALVLDNELIKQIMNHLINNPSFVYALPGSNHRKFQSTLLWMAKYDLIELRSSESAI